jgi:chemotaxis protein methyltransferase CheR
MDKRVFDALRKLVYAQTGIVLSESKLTMLESRLSSRVRELGLTAFNEYFDLLQTSEGLEREGQAFINAVTTNKTSFFREPHQFEFLTKQYFPQLASRAKKTGHRKLRIWSTASSTGEEPWSLAMTVAECFEDASQWDIRILATDVDTKVLANASDGVYTKDSADEIGPARMQRFFTRNGDALRVNDELRRWMTFKPVNLMHENWAVHAKFDLILCRNVSIYFDRPTQEKLFNRLTEFLLPGGWLFVGHAEVLHWMSQRLDAQPGGMYRVKPGAEGAHGAPVAAERFAAARRPLPSGPGPAPPPGEGIHRKRTDQSAGSKRATERGQETRASRSILGSHASDRAPAKRMGEPPNDARASARASAKRAGGEPPNDERASARASVKWAGGEPQNDTRASARASAKRVGAEASTSGEEPHPETGAERANSAAAPPPGFSAPRAPRVQSGAMKSLISAARASVEAVTTFVSAPHASDGTLNPRVSAPGVNLSPRVSAPRASTGDFEIEHLNPPRASAPLLAMAPPPLPPPSAPGPTFSRPTRARPSGPSWGPPRPTAPTAHEFDVAMSRPSGPYFEVSRSSAPRPSAPPVEVPTISAPRRMVRASEVRGQLTTIAISAGELHTSATPVEIRTILGSCVAACLYDPVARVGGMNHFLLPRSSLDHEEQLRFGVHAMEMLINGLMQLGAARDRLEAKLFGGGNVIDTVKRRPSVGEMNVKFATEFLERERIPLVSSKLGGTRGLDVRFHAHDGRAFAREISDTLVKRIESELQEKTSQKVETGTAELF